MVIFDDSKFWWYVENLKYETGYVFFNYVKKSKFNVKNWLKSLGFGKSLKENGVMNLFGEYFVL